MAIFWDLQLVWGESNKLSHFKQRHIKMLLCSSSRSNVVVFNWSHQLMFFFNRQSLHAVAVEACACQCVCARVWVCLCVDLWVCACEWVWVYGCYKGRIGMVLFAWLWLIGDELPPACTNKTFINAFTHYDRFFPNSLWKDDTATISSKNQPFISESLYLCVLHSFTISHWLINSDTTFLCLDSRALKLNSFLLVVRTPVKIKKNYSAKFSSSPFWVVLIFLSLSATGKEQQRHQRHQLHQRH